MLEAEAQSDESLSLYIVGSRDRSPSSCRVKCQRFTPACCTCSVSPTPEPPNRIPTWLASMQRDCGIPSRICVPVQIHRAPPPNPPAPHAFTAVRLMSVSRAASDRTSHGWPRHFHNWLFIFVHHACCPTLLMSPTDQYPPSQFTPERCELQGGSSQRLETLQSGLGQLDLLVRLAGNEPHETFAEDSMLLQEECYPRCVSRTIK